jgi:hypothetical protein
MMSTSILLERSVPGIAPLSGPSTGWHPTGSPAAASWCVVPRCRLEFKKCTGGFKINCHCDDEVACGTLQNLCRMLSDGLCSCCCTCNGIAVCQCSLTMGICKCEMTKDGCQQHADLLRRLLENSATRIGPTVRYPMDEPSVLFAPTRRCNAEGERSLSASR